jgi:hypothetical protein
MTGREFLNSRVRRVRMLTLSGVAIVIGSLVAMTFMRGALSIGDQVPFVFTLGMIAAGFALAIAGKLALSAVRCPWCVGELGSLVHRRLSIAHVKFCLHCGKSLDDTLNADGKFGKTGLKKAVSWDDDLAC